MGRYESYLRVLRCQVMQRANEILKDMRETRPVNVLSELDRIVEQGKLRGRKR